MRLAIAVPTYNRPTGLGTILPLLAQQAALALTRPEVDEARVLVVDNNPQGNARDAVARIAQTTEVTRNRDVSVDYVHEPAPGLSAVRNRALRESAGSDVLVFIDDDEVPSARWIDHLLQTFAAYDCAAVVGPVRSEFEVKPSAWVLNDGFFARIHQPTGTEMEHAATNNLLLDLRRVRGHGLDFDPRFGLTGGEDSDFTLRLTKAGGRIVWCDEAEVSEIVSAHRTSARWLFRRNMRTSSAEAHARRLQASPGVFRVCRLACTAAGGVARIGVGTGRAVMGQARGNERDLARGVRLIARGVGMVGGSLGWSVQEYSRANA